MRDYAVFLIVFGLLPVCLVRPFVGILLWSWIGYMNPHRLTWGLAWDFPFAQVVAIATLAGFGVKVLKDGFPRLPWERETVLLVLLWLMFTVTSFTALREDLTWPEWNKISKILLMTFLILALVNSEKRLRILLIVTALSLGFYGFKGGLFSIVSRGQHRVFGPEGSFIEDNNALGLALNMILPMLFFLPRDESNRWVKRGLYAVFFLTLLSVIFTYSRGAFLGLAVVLSQIFFRLTWKQKMVIAVVAVLMMPVVFTLIPQQWFERIQTIRTFDQDGSAMGRIEAWKTAWKLALDHPLTGGGFQIIDDPDIHELYNPGLEKQRGVHSVFFEVLAENGFVTFTIFVVLLVSSVLSTRKVRRLTRKDESRKLYHYACMFEISILAYAVTGMFLELASFDLFYQILAMVVVLKSLTRQQLLRAEKTRSAEMSGSFGPRNLAVGEA